MIRRAVRFLLLSGIFTLINTAQSLAQCAMCRASVESTVSEGNIGLASKLNTGILYLFVAPYLLVAIVGYLWYKKSRENAMMNKGRKTDFRQRTG
jgi:hypothetical protein